MDILRNRNLIIYIVFVVILSTGLILIDRYRAKELSKYHTTESQKADYITFIQNHRTGSIGKIDIGPKPINRNRIEITQNSMLQRISNYKMDVTSMNMIAQPQNSVAPVYGIEYEITVLGTWDNILNFLNSLKTDSALITVRSLTMEPSKDQIRAQFKYKFHLIN